MNAWVLGNIFLIVASIAGGLLFNHLTGPTQKEDKKAEWEVITSLLINFILFVWVGKVIMNLPLFITDPLAVLAYPSASPAFFTAVCLTAANIAYRVKRNTLKTETFTAVFLPVFLGTAFTYEFLDFVLRNNLIALGQEGLLLLLMVVFILFQEKLPPVKMTCILFAGWSLGQLILSFTLPYTSLFGYMMSEWFFVLVFVTSIIVLFYNRKKVT
ncbi:hypothetical protein EU245_07750 [Lentibacillus lipolyticus]|nr:hypothetical protein EU245_07750 [Lentibacillus lipolyticus]